MKRLATPGWLLCHLVMVALVVLFLRLGWWQLTRAEGGNGLSIGYTLEWPVFAAFVVVVWFREVRGVLRGVRGTSTGEPGAADPAAGPATAAPDRPGTTDVLAQARAERAARTLRALDARDTEGVSAHE